MIYSNENTNEASLIKGLLQQVHKHGEVPKAGNSGKHIIFWRPKGKKQLLEAKGNGSCC